MSPLLLITSLRARVSVPVRHGFLKTGFVILGAVLLDRLKRRGAG